MKNTVCALAIAALALTACAKPEQAPASEQIDTATDISAEQQALIDSVDQPLDDAVATVDLTTEKTAKTTDGGNESAQ